MNRRNFLRGVTMVLTGMGIGAVAATPEAPVLTPLPTPPRTLPQIPVLPGSMVAVPQGTPYHMEDGQWALAVNPQYVQQFHMPDDCESCVNERIQIWIDAYLQTPEGKAEVAALAKELMSGV